MPTDKTNLFGAVASESYDSEFDNLSHIGLATTASLLGWTGCTVGCRYALRTK